jgi:hypothetical protein
MGYAMTVNNDGIWEIKSSRFEQLKAPVLCALMGFGMCTITVVAWVNDDFAAFMWIGLLGLVILTLSIWGLLGNIRRIVTVLQEKQLILITDTGRYKKTQQQVINFSQVQDVYLTETKGDDSSSYDLQIKLETGKTVSLFGGALFSGVAVFDGIDDKNIMQKRCDKLRQYLNL